MASMLVSPFMVCYDLSCSEKPKNLFFFPTFYKGPIMGFVIGIRIRDKKLWLSGLKSESIGIAVSVFVGFLLGLCTTWSETRWGSSESFPTKEMRTRSKL